MPVLCIGNLTVGGTGKTTAVLDLAQRLQDRGMNVHCLTRGYRAENMRPGDPVRVDLSRHTAKDVGDEALLLAAVAPCWVSPDRVASAGAAIGAGADCLIMDDGFQNPGLYKDLSLVLVDGAVGFGNGCVLPAGPLRENLAVGLNAANAVVITGKDKAGVKQTLRQWQHPILNADLQMDETVTDLRDKAVIAFAGLARPDKFFEGLRENGVHPLNCIPFPDHHPFSDLDLSQLTHLALQAEALLVTTPKDAARLPPAFRRKVQVVGVGLHWTSPEMIESLLDHLLMEKEQ